VSDGTRLREEFLLDPDVTFLNHGSFGACPRAVFETYQQWQLELERQPVLFLARRLDGSLAEARAALGAYVGADPDDLVFVLNTTAGVNIAAWPSRLARDDEVLTTDLEYGRSRSDVGTHLRRIRRALHPPAGQPADRESRGDRRDRLVGGEPPYARALPQSPHAIDRDHRAGR
jgi:hypothetical protein